MKLTKITKSFVNVALSFLPFNIYFSILDLLSIPTEFVNKLKSHDLGSI